MNSCLILLFLLLVIIISFLMPAKYTPIDVSIIHPASIIVK